MTESLQRILYLEDDPLIAELALMALEDSGGFTVRHCFLGQQAIDVAAEFVPQLLLFDVMLPDIDGLQTYFSINSQFACANIPVVFMTAKGQRHQEQAYLDQGACGVIVKPFDPLTLPDQLHAFWSAACPEGSSATPGISKDA
jgi:DNA-binding response OmpR family regulator